MSTIAAAVIVSSSLAWAAVGEPTITFSGELRNDQTLGVQQEDDDLAIGYDANNIALAGLSGTFRTHLLGLGGNLKLLDDQLIFAHTAEAAKSASNFITVNANGASITTVFFSNKSGALLQGEQVYLDDPENSKPMKTIDGDDVYLWSQADPRIALATTSNVSGEGQIVAAFYLIAPEELGSLDNFNAAIEVVTFKSLVHPIHPNPDDEVDWSDVLNVSTSGSLSFTFDTLESGKFLWVAVGNSTQGLLVTGYDLNVDAAGKRVSGGEHPSDAVNTSQGGQNATIGIDSQMFVPFEKAVFTLVEGFGALGTGLSRDGQTDHGRDGQTDRASRGRRGGPDPPRRRGRGRDGQSDHLELSGRSA